MPSPLSNLPLAHPIALLPLALDKGRGGRGVRVCAPGHPPHQGITLVEVVVGLVLLSTLLTVILISTGRLHRQQKAALQKLDAVRILDDLTGEFFRQGFPRLDSTGPIESRPDRNWQMTGRPNPIAPDRLLDVRISILNQTAAAQSQRLATVELLVPVSSIGKYKK